jgi:hypothetical protein
MKNKGYISIFLLVLLFSLPQFVLAGGNGQEQSSAWRLETQGWSIQDHMTAAKAKEGEVQSMGNRVQDIEERIAHYENKPHFDPKGFHRNALKQISSTLKGNKNLLDEKIAWHYSQTDQAKVTE